MMRLLLILAALLIASPAFAFDASSDPATAPWADQIHRAAKRFGIPELWIREVIRQESGGHAFTASGRPITSWTGAMGLMQLMPKTYAMLRARYGLGANPYDPENNIMAGAAYIREMYDQFGAPGFLAAYNAGPARAQAYYDGDQELPRETANYMARVAPRIRRGEVIVATNTAPDSDEPMPPDLIEAVVHSGGLGSGWKAIKGTENPSTSGNIEFNAPLLMQPSEIVDTLKPVSRSIREASRADVEAAMRNAAGAAYAAHSWIGMKTMQVANKTGAVISAAYSRLAGDEPQADDQAAEKPVKPAELVTPIPDGMGSDNPIHTVSYQLPAGDNLGTEIAPQEPQVPLPASLGRTAGYWMVDIGSLIDPSLAPIAFRKLGHSLGAPFNRLQKLVKSVDQHGTRVYQMDVIGLTPQDATTLCDAMIRRNLSCTLLPSG